MGDLVEMRGMHLMIILIEDDSSSVETWVLCFFGKA